MPAKRKRRLTSTITAKQPAPRLGVCECSRCCTHTSTVMPKFKSESGLAGRRLIVIVDPVEAAMLTLWPDVSWRFGAACQPPILGVSTAGTRSNAPARGECMRRLRLSFQNYAVLHWTEPAEFGRFCWRVGSLIRWPHWAVLRAALRGSPRCSLR